MGRWKPTAELGAFALGFAGGAIPACRDQPGPGPIELWVADRGADLLHGLDADLIHALRIEVAAPVALARAPRGPLWVASAIDGSPGGRHRLIALGDDGSLREEHAFGPVVDLAAAASGHALALERTDDGSRVRGTGSTRIDIPVGQGASCLAAGAGRFVVGDADGFVRSFALPFGEPCGAAWVGAPVVALAVGPDPASWWVLAGGEDGRGSLALLDGGLEIRWLRDLRFRPAALAAVPGRERVWVAERGAARASRYGAAGRFELECVLAHRGVGSGVATPEGGVAWSVPGAVLVFDPAGRPVPGQGGFGFSSELVRAFP